MFRNELEYWCAQGYDYLGAPWFKDATTMYSKAGNGGFSLRNIQACLDAIDCGVHRTFAGVFKRHKKKHLISNILHFPVVIASYLFDKLWPEQLSKSRKNEDVVWAYDAKLKAIPSELALKFSFECYPRKLYELNNRQLPFGCHAFEKWEYDFWKQFINVKESLSLHQR